MTRYEMTRYGCTMCGSTSVLMRIEGAVLEYQLNAEHRGAAKSASYYPDKDWVTEHGRITITCQTCGHSMDKHHEISDELYQRGINLSHMTRNMDASGLAPETQARIRELVQADLIAQRLQQDGATK